MDVQFVLDVYACAMYIVSYISKAQKCISELLRKACAEAKEGNASIKQQVRDVGNKFLNKVEISAQEAVYIYYTPITNDKSFSQCSVYSNITSRRKSPVVKGS